MAEAPISPAMPTHEVVPYAVPPRPLASASATASVPLRFEDITQDGQLRLDGLAAAFSPIGWQLQRSFGGAKALVMSGVVPIFTRILYEGGGGPFSTKGPLEAEGTFQLAQAVTPAGVTERLVIHVWIDGTLPLGRNFGPRPEHTGEPVPAGKIFMEQTFTRLFAEPGARKVLRLEAPGLPAVPEPKVPFVPPAALLDLPAGATLLDDAPRPDEAPLVFGLNETDSNQHVNSLVYPRLFEAAAVRRFHALGRGGVPRIARFVDVAFRKPCFAGQRYAMVLQAFEHEGRLGAVGAFVNEGDFGKPLGEARAHCFARMLFNTAP